MATGTIFPAFTRIEHQRDGSAKASFIADVEDLINGANRKLSDFSKTAQATLDGALSVSRNKSGALDLGVPQLKAAADAQQARAIAAKEVASATLLAAREEGQYTQAVRLNITATKQLADQEQAAALAAKAHAAAAEQVQERLNRQKSATDAVVAATRRGTDANGAVTNSSRAHRTAMVQLGQQMQDMVVQWQSGTNAVTIFTQQVPQAAFALSGMAGKIGSVARVLSGPLGAGLLLATSLLGPLIVAMLKGGDASDDLEKKTLSLHDALQKSALGTDAARKALEDYNAEQDKARDNAERMIKINLGLAESALKSAQGTRQQLAAQLELQYNEMSRAPIGATGEELGAYQAGVVGGASAIQAKIAQNNKDIETYGKNIRNLRIEDAGRDAAAAVDPVKAINNRFDDMAEAAKAAAAGNDRLSKSLKGLLTDYERQRKAALDAAKDAKGSANDARATAYFGSPVAGGSISGRFGESRPGHQHGGNDYAVPVGTPVRAVADGVVTFAGKRGNYGNLVAINAGGPETRDAHLSQIIVGAGDQVSKGDIIGYSGGARGAPGAGNSQGPHVHHEVRVGGKPVNPVGNYKVDPGKAEDIAARQAEAVAKAQERLDKLGESAAASIEQVNRQFDDQPRLVDQAGKAVSELNSLIADLTAKNVDGQFDGLIQQAKEAIALAQSAPNRALEKYYADRAKDIEVQGLLLSGRKDEAAVLSALISAQERYGHLSQDQIKYVAQQTMAEEHLNDVIERRREQLDLYLGATRSIRGELESIFAGEGGDLGKVFKRLQAQLTVEKLFGSAFRDLEKQLKGDSGIDAAVKEFTGGTSDAGKAAIELANTFRDAASQLKGGSVSGSPAASAFAANDNGDLSEAAWTKITQKFDNMFGKGLDPNGDIVVTGNRSGVATAAKPDRNTVGGTTLASYSEAVAAVMTKPLIDAIGGISPELAAKLGPMLNGAIGGYMTGGIPGGILGGLKELPGLGDKLSKELGKAGRGAATGSMVAGIGKSLGIKMSNTGAQIGGAIGSFIPIPGGSLIGSVIGGLLGNLFHSVKSGYAQIRPSGADVAVTGTYGRTGSLQNDASKAANALIDSVRSLADQLGGSLGAFDMDIGTKDDKFVVNLGDGRGGTNTFNTEEEATRFAIIGAINKGAIRGIKDSTKNLLVAGNDIETQLKKAMDFESVFKRLRAQTDPVGAAIDAVDTEFKRLQGIFKEAGASTAEYADLEKLYGIERTKAVKDAASQMTGALKGLLDDLTIGDNGLSLSDRRANAMAKYQPLADQVKAGDVSAYDDFAEAARSLIDISREMYGSQNPYFELFNEVKGITQGALDASTAIANQSAGSASIFTASTASNDNTSVVSAIDGMNSDLVNQLTAANTNLGILIKQGLGSGDLQSLAQYVGPMWQPQGYF